MHDPAESDMLILTFQTREHANMNNVECHLETCMKTLLYNLFYVLIYVIKIRQVVAAERARLWLNSEP